MECLGRWSDDGSASGSDSDDDTDNDWTSNALERAAAARRAAPLRPVGQAQCQHQRAFVQNLWKLLLDAHRLCIESWIRWDVRNGRVGYTVDWNIALSQWPVSRAVLARYRLTRRTNRATCAIASWHRKKREWSFVVHEVSRGVYFYYCMGFTFRPGSDWNTFPESRRRVRQSSAVFCR